jgi:glucans biosynthesis protein C
MPLIFVISGASVFYALGKGGWGKFVKDKALRLLAPLVVGVFTHASLQVYIERVSHGQFSGSYFEFLPHYFDGLYLPGSSGNFAFSGMHLWYLLFLFLFTIVLLPLFYWLKSAHGSRVVGRVGDVLALPVALCLLALPTRAAERAGPQQRSWPQNGRLGFAAVSSGR